jgi:hypothetical protein
MAVDKGWMTCVKIEDLFNPQFDPHQLPPCYPHHRHRAKKGENDVISNDYMINPQKSTWNYYYYY